MNVLILRPTRFFIYFIAHFPLPYLSCHSSTNFNNIINISAKNYKEPRRGCSQKNHHFIKDFMSRKEALIRSEFDILVSKAKTKQRNWQIYL